MMTPTFVSLLLALAAVATMTQSASVGFQGIEENCILSFVVPRDKMKSSCELDSKVNRRINAMEMKVNIYKQQVAELHGQLEKQRTISQEKLDALDKQVKESTVNADMSFLIERRLALLEKEFEQLHEDLAKVKGKPTLSPDYVGQGTGSFNTLDNNPVTLPNLVRSMVQSEVKTLMVNFTRQIESYVQEQVLLYNRVFNLLPDPKDDRAAGRTTFNLGNPFGDEDKGGKKSNAGEGSPLDKEILTEFDEVKSTLDNTGEQIAKHVGDLVKNLTTPYPESDVGPGLGLDSEPGNVTSSWLNDTTFTESDNSSTTQEVSLENHQLLESNEALGGDSSSNNPDRQIVALDNLTSLTSLDTEIPVSSRISHGADEAKDGQKGVMVTGDGKGEKWKQENMIRDQQQTPTTAFQEKLRTEITSMLYSPLAKVMKMMEKQSAKLEGQMATQREEAQEATSTLRSQVKALEQHVLSTAVKVDSLTKGFQDMREVVDAVKVLEVSVSEMKKNLSTSQGAGVSSPELDEHLKKVKKLERLIVVYQHSLDHYRNETKLEYREIRSLMDKETKNLRGVSTDLQTSVTNRVDSALNKLNSTYMDRLQEITDQIRIHEDNAMLMQIDINNIDRKVSGKSSRSDKEIDDLKDSIRQATNKHRDIRRRLESLEKEQGALGDQLNATVKDIFDLKTEVRLTVLDEWLPLEFEYDLSRTDCHGEQYVRQSPYKEARLVGVVLCSPMRYKIFLSSSMQSTFLNIGDTDGLGEDHCEFVGAKEGSKITLSPFSPSFTVVKGYARSLWGEAPELDYLNAIKPSPHWYECGVKIP